MSSNKVSIDDIKFGADGLVPAAVVDSLSKKLLMLAYMNRESLEKTMETGLATFWSRSRKELWTKGETSGNYQHVVNIKADCDRDSLLLEVEPDGPACHLGTESCFEYPLWENGEKDAFSADDLYRLLADRKQTMPEGSYTSYLFSKGTDKILKKVGEECTEVIIAAKAEDKPETVYEIADLAYHVMVLMVEQGISLADVRRELAARHIIDHKVKQEKMTGKDQG